MILAITLSQLGGLGSALPVALKCCTLCLLPSQVLHCLAFPWSGLILWHASQIIGTSAIRISWGKNSMSRMQGGAPYPGFGGHPSVAPPTALPGDLSYPYFQQLPGAAGPAVDPYAAYAYALQQQASSASSPLLQVIVSDLHLLLCTNAL